MRNFIPIYRSGQTDRDTAYFLRRVDSISFPVNPHNVHPDRAFSVNHDYLVAEIIANEMIEDYLEQALTHIRLNKNNEVKNREFFPVQMDRIQGCTGRTDLRASV